MDRTVEPARSLALVRWLGVLLFLECFVYKNIQSPLSLDVGVTLTPDRLVFGVVLALGAWKLGTGELQFPAVRRVGVYMFLFTLVCTVSCIVSGNGLTPTAGGYDNLTRLVDFTYKPFLIFVIAKSIPHSDKKLRVLTSAFLALGAYLAINGVFEHFELHTLVWPKYILDPTVGIQFGRTRGSFASSMALGGALIMTFLFYLLSTTWADGGARVWKYGLTFLTAGVIYTTNQRSVWLCFALCLTLLVILRSPMRPRARVLACIVCLGFFSGVASHFSFLGGTLFSRRQDTIDYRWVNYLADIEMIKANTFLGIGWGNFKTEWSAYVRPIPGVDIHELTDGNHNTFLGLFAEVGLAGLLPYALILYSMFHVALRVFRRGSGLERDLGLLLLLIAGSYMIEANFSDYRCNQFFNTALYLVFGTVAGSPASGLQPAGSEWESRARLLHPDPRAATTGER